MSVFWGEGVWCRDSRGPCVSRVSPRVGGACQRAARRGRRGPCPSDWGGGGGGRTDTRHDGTVPISCPAARVLPPRREDSVRGRRRARRLRAALTDGPGAAGRLKGGDPRPPAEGCLRAVPPRCRGWGLGEGGGGGGKGPCREAQP